MPKKKDDDEKQTSLVFIKDKEFAWRPAVLEDTQGNNAIVTVPEYKDQQSMQCDGGRAAKKGEQKKINLKDYAHGVLPLQNVDANGVLVEFPDMVKLPYLHEAAILYNLKKRHGDGKPYTRTGDIIIAVNPFQWFLDLYTERKRVYYSNRIVWEDSEKDPRDGMEPHVYEVSALCYKGLCFDRVDQSILVSGESGAGKTETVKICMNHMAVVQEGPRGEVYDDDKNELDPVVKRVVESNPLLEAFGNAKTRRNDNSSRFGKYLQLQFDNSKQGPGVVSKTHSTCTLAGSKCDVYLLEKNRVTVHDTEERTYHIFYQILSAPEADKAQIWSGLKGKKFKDFKYVGHTDTLKIEKETDAQHYDHTTSTLNMINVSGDKLMLLYRAVTIVMQCGNLTFGALKGDKDKSDITSAGELKALADLMGVSPQDLTLAFTERTMKTKTESYKVPLNAVFAKDACDAFAKECYGKLFLWLVNEINCATRAEENYKNGSMADFDYGIVGLLDIFGFESFTVNRFEQLCINYANEKLQQKFTEDVFRSVQLEYEAEGIELAEITYDDNTDVLDLIEGRTGLLAMLNEECVRPRGNDQEFVQKALSMNKKSPCLIVNKLDRMSFGIHHYAGKVMYDADQFVSSNQDTLPTDLEEIGTKSSNSIVANPATEVTKMEAPTKKRQKSNLVAPTVWGKYKTQLGHLMGNLRKTSSRYIRCVKPNMAKKPILMDHVPTVEQLRCAGVVAAVTLARSAFPNRLDNSAVKFRYNSMWEKSQFPSRKQDGMSPAEALRADCDAILTCALKPKEYVRKDGTVGKAFVVGKTKAFFRAGALEYLEANRASGLDAQAVTIQRFARGMVTRKRLQHMRGASKRQAEEERKAREEAERRRKEKLAREAAELEAKRKAAMEKYEKKLETLKRDLDEEDQERKERIKEAIDKKAQFEQELEELKEQTGEEARKALMEPKRIAAAQKKKLEEQTKMIAMLQTENKKSRKSYDKAKARYDEMKENFDKLQARKEETGADYESGEMSAKKVEEKHETLMNNIKNSKADNKRLKEECMEKQATYMKQAETRLEYQKALAHILTLIQNWGEDRQLVEETVMIALECESESKSIMAALEAETSEY